MLKIREEQYSNAYTNHNTNISGNIEMKIAFYLYCFTILNNQIGYDINNPYKVGLNGNNINAMVKTIYNIDLRITAQNITEIFIHRENLKREIFEHLPELVTLFNEFLRPDSNISYNKIICSNPTELIDIHQYLLRNYSFMYFNTDNSIKEEFDSIFNKIFDYDAFIDGGINGWSAYNLTNLLGLKVCPYCNRQFTYTVFNSNHGKITRPELDHYLPQSRYPYFALSFFNLIPCCNICNSTLKGDKEFGLLNIFHPYLNNIDEELHFVINYDTSKETIDEIEESLDILIRPIFDQDRNIKVFVEKLEQIYKEHKDICAHYIWKKRSYPEQYIEDMADIGSNGNVMMKNNNINKLRQAIFPRLDRYVDIINTPLGKLMKDSMNQI